MIFPIVASSLERPRASPHAARTAGATCATTTFFLSAIALHTSSVSSRSRSAPTGQCVIHCPHREQDTSLIFLFPLTLIVVLEPVLVTSQMFSPWILSQIWIQRIHLIHLRESRMSGNVLSQGVSSKRSLNGRSIRFRSFATC